MFVFLRLFKYLWPERYLPEPEQEDPFNEDPAPRGAAKLGVLLVNLGTPDTPDRKDIRRYLREFLSDPRVIEIPRYLWKPILHCLVLTMRPKKLEPRYAGVWMKEGSPLMVYSRRQADGVRERRGRRLIAPGGAVCRHVERHHRKAVAGQCVDHGAELGRTALEAMRQKDGWPLTPAPRHQPFTQIESCAGGRQGERRRRADVLARM